MNNKLLKRRTFVKKVSIGAVGVTSTAGGISSLYTDLMEDIVTAVVKIQKNAPGLL